MKRWMPVSLALALAACGASGGASTIGGQTPTTPPSTPDSVVSGGGTVSASCLAGTWALDSEAFLRASYGRFTTDGTEPAFGDFTGDFEVTFSSDGGFHGVRHAWSWAIGTAQGLLRTTLDGDDGGTWTLSGDGLTMDKQSNGVTGTVKLEVDGQPVDVPVPPSSDIDTDLLNGTVAADCQGDTLTLTKEVPAVFTRTTPAGG